MEGLTRQEVEYRKNNGLSNDEKVKYTTHKIYKLS